MSKPTGITKVQISVSMAARWLGMSPDAVVRLIKAGKLPAEKDGRDWMVSASAVEARRAELNPSASPPLRLLEVKSSRRTSSRKM